MEKPIKTKSFIVLGIVGMSMLGAAYIIDGHGAKPEADHAPVVQVQIPQEENKHCADFETKDLKGTVCSNSAFNLEVVQEAVTRSLKP